MPGGLRPSLVALAACGLLSADPAPAEEVARGRPPKAATTETAKAAPGCSAASVPDRILRLEPGGEIVLGSGLRVRLVDLRMPEAGEASAGARPNAGGWLASLVDQAVAVAVVGPPDRWGRMPARLSLGDARGPIDVADLLVAEGFAVTDVGEREALCRPDLLRAEQAARLARRGLWAAGPGPLPAGEPDALRAAEGRFVLVEGRVVSVGERSGVTYLNFGRNFARDFAVVIPKRRWAAMKRTGLGAAELTGRRVRVRGAVEVRRGPVMELVAADMLEWQDIGPDRP